MRVKPTSGSSTSHFVSKLQPGTAFSREPACDRHGGDLIIRLGEPVALRFGLTRLPEGTVSEDGSRGG